MDMSAFTVTRLLERLLDNRREPRPYAPGSHPLWTKEHVSGS